MILLISSGIILIILYFIYQRGENEVVHNLVKFSMKMILIALFLELTLFNFRFYESLWYKEIKVSNYTLGEGLKKDKNGNIKVISDKKNYIDIIDIHQHLNNIHLDFDAPKDNDKVLYVSIGYRDAANGNYGYAQERRISANPKNEGEILRLHLAGKSSRIRIYVNTVEEYDTFSIKSISFNKRVPINISWVRPLMIVALALIIYIFRPKSSIYKISLFDKKYKKYIFITVGLELIFLGVVSHFNYYFIKENFKTNQRMQYQLLAEAFAKGQTYLDIEPHQILKNLKNPYDKRKRNEAFEVLYKGIDETKKSDDYYIWDAAFYNNKYYVYFGVAPVITYYLPFYLITGNHLKTTTCINITMILCVIGIILLLYEVCKKWFKKVNMGAFLALFLLFVNACGILSIMGRPDHYSLPIFMAIMFSVYGLFFWFKALDKDLKASYLFLGSLCMASVAACRPQILLTSFLAIPLFWDKIFKERKLFTKETIKKTVGFVLPYVVIAGLLMAYNYVRFGSPFDFGANYNLTTNDMTRRGFVIGRIPLGIFYYLLRPFNLTLKFPFIMRDGVATNYMGTTIFEEMGAGFLIANLLCLFGIFIFRNKEDFKEKMPYKIGVMMVISALVIIIADTQMAGILPRYICDFGFMLYLATCLVLFNKLNKNENNDKLHKLIYAALIFGLVYNFMLLFSDNILWNSNFYFYIKGLFEFWL